MTAIRRGEVLIFKGCNFFRQRLVLSVLSSKSVKITDIRTLDDAPGLKEFEVSLVRLLDKVTNGTVIEINDEGTSIYFQPGLLYGGTIEHDCSLERGIGYYLEALFMLSLFCKKPLNATLRGVTNTNIDPSVDLLKTSMITTMKNFIYDHENLDVSIKKRGLRPLGGGEIVFKCPIGQQLRPVQLLESGLVKRVRGTAFALRVSPAIANRIVDKAKGVMLNFIPDVFITADQRRGKQSGNSPGFGVHLTAETTKGVIYSAEAVSNVVAFGEEPSLPEDLGEAASQRLCKEIFLGGVVDSTSQALAILFMALGPQDVSKIVTGNLTDYTVGFLRNLKEFFGVTFKIEKYHAEEFVEGSGCEKVLLSCVGLGYTNLSKRTI
ncbi:probable RNA 3'-terminal phosphate cyclase-like protein [Coccinella septempunctata]|uniref:probable RNA 3'-terminal phosphate cyclase-like protein n=1 Tax=Coccinella septempunctata TaxID=41139 RepID=UPI001D067A14|nr:probable RNA 3'-terminal phosphate cyclase-like protein [Coccinella septempunctata]